MKMKRLKNSFQLKARKLTKAQTLNAVTVLMQTLTRQWKGENPVPEAQQVHECKVVLKEGDGLLSKDAAECVGIQLELYPKETTVCIRPTTQTSEWVLLSLTEKGWAPSPKKIIGVLRHLLERGTWTRP
jgi:hypothetical protein